MKLKEKQQIASLSFAELTKELMDVKKQITEMKLGRYTKPAKNTRAIRALKIRCAVLQTNMQAKNNEPTKE
jgi:ribosomal protein L29